MSQFLKKSLTFATLVLFLALPGGAQGDPMDELILDMDRKFEGLKPAPHSSVQSDYLLAQTAAGTLYITKAIGILHEQNQALLESNLEIIARYDKMIEQNQQIIELMKTLKEHRKASAPPSQGEETGTP